MPVNLAGMGRGKPPRTLGRRAGADGAHLVGARAGGHARKMARSCDTGARMDALLQGADWGPMGTNSDLPADVFSVEETEPSY